MSEFNKDKELLISISVGVIAGVVVGFAAHYFTKELEYGVVLSYWGGLVLGLLIAPALYLERARRAKADAMSTLQVALYSAILGLIAALFSYVMAEIDSKIKAAIISGLGVAVAFFLLIRQEQKGHRESKRYTKHKNRSERDK